MRMVCVFVTNRYSLSVCTPFLLASLCQYHVMILMKTILLLMSLKLMDSSFILRNFPFDMIHCTTNVTWSNIKFSTAQDVFNFS